MRKKEDWKNKGRPGFSACYLILQCLLLLYELKGPGKNSQNRTVEFGSLQPVLGRVLYGP